MDDHPLVRKTVKDTLQQELRFDVVGEAENGLEAVKKVKELTPKVVVLDINMPVMSGFEAARRILQDLPEAAIVILSTHVDNRLIDEAKKIGVRACVAKSKAAVALVKAIEGAINNDEFFLAQ